MKGPYTYRVSLAETAVTGAERIKRIAVRLMRAATKQLGVSPDGQDKAQGEVRDESNRLLKQVEAYRTPGGAIKLRDLEL
jgi:hypothetical protein